MREVPREGDRVVMVCDKKEVLIGIVVHEFQEGTLHRADNCTFSKGDNGGHREPEYYASIRIISLGDLTPNRGCQRTWTTYKIREA